MFDEQTGWVAWKNCIGSTNRKVFLLEIKNVSAEKLEPPGNGIFSISMKSHPENHKIVAHGKNVHIFVKIISGAAFCIITWLGNLSFEFNSSF